MPKRKKVFPCGHSGYGSFCHRCRAKEERLARDRERRESWAATFDSDSIDLTGLPRGVVVKTREVLAKLAGGEYWGRLGGKRMRSDRNVISIPIGRDYRLLCRDHGDRIVPERALSHEDYNTAKPGNR